MGFLKNLIGNGISNGISNGIKKGVSNAVSGAVQKAVNPVAEKWANKTAENLDQAAGNLETNVKETNNAFENLKRATENYAATMEQVAKNNGVYVGQDVVYTKDMFEDDGIAAAVKIRQVLAENFSNYEVRENVSPATIGGTGNFMNYSFAVYSAGAPKLFIMLIGKTTCAKRLYRFSKEQAAKAGVPMINFIEHYPNNVKYIQARLQKYL